MTATTADAAAGLRAWADRSPRWLSAIGPALAIIAIQQVLFPTPLGIVVRGAVVGGLTALVALGMALIHRSNRILNLAQADLGGVSAVLVVMLITAWGWSYAIAVPAGLLAGLVAGGLVELVIIRRFRKAPRLILTVATIGLAQLLAAAALLLPRAFDEGQLLAPRIDPPFSYTFRIGEIIFNANDLIAMVVAPLAVVGLAFFLQRTSLGVAVRASATSGQRAGLLGIPVDRLQTLVWALAGGMAFLATFLRAGILGLPTGGALSSGVLLRALAALMIGRMTNLTAITTSAVALGMLELGVQWNASSPLLIDPILAGVIGGALLLQRRRAGRGDADASSWQAAEEVRPVPKALAGLREVRLVRAAGAVLLVVVALGLPNVLSVDRSLKASAVLIYAILALSLVVLTGWGGLVSLGQVAFFAIGAVVGAKASIDYGLDLVVALPLSALVGGVVAVLVGIPALRGKGFTLAVSTFAFALATTSYFLNRRFFDWIPDDRVPRRAIFGKLDIDSPTRMYYVSLVGLVLILVLLHGIRHSRTGRVLVALRENERAAEAYGIDAMRVRLTAFALSGAIAAFAGCLFVHHQQAYGTGPYDPSQNFAAFTMAVIGGIASVPGALLGALYLRGTQWFLPTDWQFLASGFGVLLVLLVIPGGLGGQLYKVRDLWLRSVAKRNDIDVPSLVGVARTADDSAPPPIARRPRPAVDLTTGELLVPADGGAPTGATSTEPDPPDPADPPDLAEGDAGPTAANGAADANGPTDANGAAPSNGDRADGALPAGTGRRGDR
ncbi:hypothetical protein BH10ACT1_BH10ACT1_05800 [soil metagenome]